MLCGQNTPTSAGSLQGTLIKEWSSQKTSWAVQWWHHRGELDILGATSRGEMHLLTLEALWIRELKPYLNTQDTMRSRDLKLTIKLWQFNQVAYYNNVKILFSIQLIGCYYLYFSDLMMHLICETRKRFLSCWALC